VTVRSTDQRSHLYGQGRVQSHAIVLPHDDGDVGYSQKLLTGNHKVPYCKYGTKRFPFEMDDDAVFKALADASRRQLLDRLHKKNGQTLGELCDGLDMTRQAVAKHLAILKKTNLVSWKRVGRERLHFINPVPINEIAERWINKFEQPRLWALSKLKKNLEGKSR
jgi:DNA-binding transcriptional ArsR family regulator